MSIKAIVFDLGGVLIQDGNAMPQAAEALREARQSRLPFCFLTNTTSEDKSSLLATLRALDAGIEAADLITPADVARGWLQEHGYRAWALVAEALRPVFEGLDGENGEAVVVGDIGERFTYSCLDQAFQRLQTGAPLLALGKARFFQRDGARHLDSGPFVHALEYAANAEAVVCGKPDQRAFLAAAQHLGTAPGQCCMIGDDADSDIQGALEAGLQAVLVQTGKYQDGDEHRCDRALLSDDALRAVRALCSRR